MDKPAHIINQFRIDLKYIGKDFNGWQSQADGSGIQDHIEKALSVILKQKIRLLAASRTDSGVHALHQVATFKTNKNIDLNKFKASLQALVPVSIGISSINKVSNDFHPILSALKKTYKYNLWTSHTKDPFIEPFIWRVPGVDINTLKKQACFFLGTHNFQSFCASDSTSKTKERSIYEVKILKDGNLIEVWITGNGFLKQMIRIMVGSLVDIALNKNKLSIIEMIKAANRNVCGRTAPAQGLTLMKIYYKDKIKS